MTKDEALRLALEALKMFCEHGAILRPIETRDAIKAALEAKDEPVAWYRDENGIRIYYESKVWDDAIPLYITSPQSKPMTNDEIVAEYDKFKADKEAKDEPVGYWQGEFSKDGGALLCIVPQESIFGRKYRNIPLYTTSPQRTWVGLTNIDYAGLPREQVGLVLWAEAKLKEKNYDRI